MGRIQPGPIVNGKHGLACNSLELNTLANRVRAAQYFVLSYTDERTFPIQKCKIFKNEFSAFGRMW